MRMRKKKHLDERMKASGRYLVRSPAELKGRWKGDFLFLNVELGCGKGRFICESAKAYRDTMFVAIERVPDALVMAMERAASDALENVAFICADAAEINEFFEAEIDRLFINFCDPWPARRRAQRRLTHSFFLEKYKRTLKPGGSVSLKTDNVELFDFSLKQFENCGFLTNWITRNLHESGVTNRESDVPNIETEYERRFTDLGVKICSCEASRMP